MKSRHQRQPVDASADRSRRIPRWRRGSGGCGRSIRRRRRSSDAGGETGPVAATQEALYQEHDLELSWSEASLPERERTKHVHRLHPYLGKFIPQLVETLLDRHVPAGDACSIPSQAPARRSCRRSSPGTTRPVSTSPGSTRFCPGQDAPVQPRGAAPRPAVGTRRGGSLRAARALSTRGVVVRARVVRAGSRRGAAALPVARRAGRLG